MHLTIPVHQYVHHHIFLSVNCMSVEVSVHEYFGFLMITFHWVCLLLVSNTCRYLLMTNTDGWQYVVSRWNCILITICYILLLSGFTYLNLWYLLSAEMLDILFWPHCIYSSPPNDAYMHLWTDSPLLQIMACRLFGTKPLSKPMMTSHQLQPTQQISIENWSKLSNFHRRNYI